MYKFIIIDDEEKIANGMAQLFPWQNIGFQVDQVFASQSRVPNGDVAPFGTPHKKRRYATPPRGAYRLFLLSSPPAVSVEQKSAWEWCGIFI